MRYEEYPAPRWWPGWLLLLFILLMVPHSQLPELSDAEAYYALMGREMAEGGNYLRATLLGQRAFAFPLVPWMLVWPATCCR